MAKSLQAAFGDKIVSSNIMNEKRLLYIVLIIAILGLMLALKNFLDLRALYCDLNKSVFAEREYIYPILRKTEDPLSYGPGSLDPRTVDIKNPLTSDLKYLEHCK